MMTTLTPLSVAELQALKREAAAVAGQLSRLMATLACDDEEQRAWASDCLELIDSRDITDLASLETQCTDSCPPVAGWACKLLGRVADPRSEGALVTALMRHACITVRQHAASALAHFQTLSEAAREALQAAARCDDPRLKRLATQALESEP